MSPHDWVIIGTVDAIPIDVIRRDPSIQARVEIGAARVTTYADDLSRGDRMPPVVVFCEEVEGEWIAWLADGWHRVAAVEERGKSCMIRAEMRKGGRREALIYAAGANAAHGLRRSLADKRRAIDLLLDDPVCSQWSARRIAKAARVSNSTISMAKKRRRNCAIAHPESGSGGEFPKNAQHDCNRPPIAASGCGIPHPSPSSEPQPATLPPVEEGMMSALDPEEQEEQEGEPLSLGVLLGEGEGDAGGETEWPLKIEEGLSPHEMQLLRRLAYTYGASSWERGTGADHPPVVPSLLERLPNEIPSAGWGLIPSWTHMGELLERGLLIEARREGVAVLCLSGAAWSAYSEALHPRVRYPEIRPELHSLAAQIQPGLRSVSVHETGHGVKISSCPVVEGISVDLQITASDWGGVVERLREAVELIRRCSTA